MASGKDIMGGFTSAGRKGINRCSTSCNVLPDAATLIASLGTTCKSLSGTGDIEMAELADTPVDSFCNVRNELGGADIVILHLLIQVSNE